MKILFLLNQGLGNCVEMIPTYLNLKEAGYDIDVCYLKEYDVNSAKQVAFFPCNVIEEITYNDINQMQTKYDYIVKPPMLLTGDGSFIPEYIIDMHEMDSEVQRNLRICKHLGVSADIKRQFFVEETPIPSGEYIVLHNGAQRGWEAKLYPHMLQLAHRLRKALGKPLVSIGGRGEYVFGTQDYTGLPIRKTAYVIEHSLCYVGTDTGTYHMAGIMDKRGVVIFTKTSIGKNYDGQFHRHIKPVHTDLKCQPCQKMYHHMLYGENCRNHKCREIPVERIVEAVKDALR